MEISVTLKLHNCKVMYFCFCIFNLSSMHTTTCFCSPISHFHIFDIKRTFCFTLKPGEIMACHILVTLQGQHSISGSKLHCIFLPTIAEPPRSWTRMKGTLALICPPDIPFTIATAHKIACPLDSVTLYRVSFHPIVIANENKLTLILLTSYTL